MRIGLRGLVEVVDVVLLVLVSVVGVVFMYLWLIYYIVKTLDVVGQIVVFEILKIEAAKIDTGTNTATLYIRNVGGVNVTLSNIYIFRLDSTDPLCVVSVNETLYTGELRKVVFSVGGCSIQPGYDYVVKVVTSRGAEFAVVVSV